MEWISSDSKSTGIESSALPPRGWRQAWNRIFRFHRRRQPRSDLLALIDEKPVLSLGGEVRVDVKVKEIYQKTKLSKRPSKQSVRVPKRDKQAIQPQPALREATDWYPVPAYYTQETVAFVTAMDVNPGNRSEHQEYVIETYFGRVVGMDLILKHEVVTQSEEHLETGTAVHERASEEERVLRAEALSNIESQKYCRRKSWGVTKPQGTGRWCERRI